MSAVWLGLLWSCASEDYARLYHIENKAPSLQWDAIAGLEHMGPSLVDDGVNFAVYSERATRVELLLFDDPESDAPTQQFEMAREGDVWNLFVEGVGHGQHYGFRAWGPNWDYDERFYPGSTWGFSADVDDEGNRFNPNKLLFDPYARALTRDHDWGRALTASGPWRDQDTLGAATKGIVVESQFEWSENESLWRDARRSGNHEGHGWNDLIVYEVHAKGLTKNAAANQLGVEHNGTFLGAGEVASYLSDLGITAVEFLPVNEKPVDGGYWGYQPISYFAMETTYAARQDTSEEPARTVDEFKEMVDLLHQQGIEVIVDVVYNHTGEGGLWQTKLFYNDSDNDGLCNPGDYVILDSLEAATMYNLRGLDNYAYYVLTQDGQYYWDHTGVGNQMRANHAPMRRLILDSLRYMVEDLHVDGFRFDLAGVLGEGDLAYENGWTNTEDTVLQDIIDDPVFKEHNTRFIAEPWTTAYDPSGGFPVASDGSGYGWMEWNANFRDWWRAFQNDGWALNQATGIVDAGSALTGSNGKYSWNGRGPIHSVNFVTAHDGFTMYDLVSYDEKENGCGPLNPVCCEAACSVWCDVTSGAGYEHETSYGDDEAAKRRAMRNWVTGLFVSHGTPMFLGGDEWMRTQYGNNNAYSDGADNEWNWFRWGEWQSQASNNAYRWRHHDFVKQLIQLRKNHSYALSPETFGSGMPWSWKNAQNNEMSDTDWAGRHVMMHYYDDGSGDWGPELVILLNGESTSVSFTLPGGRDWARVVDTQEYFDSSDGVFQDASLDRRTSQNARVDSPIAVSGGSYTVEPGTIVVLVQR